jgi:acetyltransferase-like isoleucine patch superfamily enzyme
VKPIISANSRIRHPDFFEIGDDSIVDDYCYFSTRVRIGVCSHIASGCSVAGGIKFLFQVGDYCGLATGAKIFCVSDDFVNDLVTILPPGADSIKTSGIAGDVIMEDYTAVGANSVVMPNNRIPVGTVIGALSFVPAAFKFEPWSVYAGIPIRLRGKRNRKNVLVQVEKMSKFLRNRDA